MDSIVCAHIYRFAHSQVVKIFFSIYIIVCLLSLTSEFASPIDLLIQSLIDMSIPSLGLSIFSGIYIGTEFRNRTIQNQISHGEKRSSILLMNFLMLIIVFVVLVFIYAFVPAFLFFLKSGNMGILSGYEEYGLWPQYFTRLCIPATLLTVARASGLFIIPFLFKDTVRTILTSIIYSLVVPMLTQSDRLQYLYQYYWPGNIDISIDIAIVAISIIILFIAYYVALAFFKRAQFK